MTRSAQHKLFLAALLLSGCQSASNLMPWQLSGEPKYTAEELASLNSPQAAAAQPQLSQAIQTVSATTPAAASSGAQPVAATRVDQLVKSGQAAIREAGDGDSAKLEKARQIFEQVIALDAGNSAAHHGLAIVADLQQDWQAAESHYKQALQQRPQDPSLLNDIGYSYLLQNRTHEARQYLTQALQLSPQLERAHINLALLSLKRGDRIGAQNQLAAIYSTPEINSTLARLEEDLQTTAQSGSTIVANEQRVTPQWPQQPIAQPLVQQAPQFQMSQGSTLPVQTAQTEKPIHVYPPGIEPPPATVAQSNGYGPSPGMTGAGSISQYGSQGISTLPAGYPQAGPPMTQATQSQVYVAPGSAMQAGPQQISGVPVGGIINPGGYPTAHQSPNAANGQSAMMPPGQNYGVNVNQQMAAHQQAPLTGLNAGPGTLFPVGQNTVNAQHGVSAPGQMPHSGQAVHPNMQQPYYGQPANVPGNAPPMSPSYPQGYGPQTQAAPQRGITTISASQYPVNTVQPQAGVSATYPGQPQPAAAANPMSNYQNQLRQLDNQYNQAIQQMDGRHNFGGAPAGY